MRTETKTTNAPAHTPGPWEVCNKRLSPRILTKDGNHVTGVISFNSYADKTTDRANARLIAAAPELLAVAQRVAKLGSDTPQSKTFTIADLQGIVSDAMQAIEKATQP